jgi:hypothetical protein
MRVFRCEDGANQCDLECDSETELHVKPSIPFSEQCAVRPPTVDTALCSFPNVAYASQEYLDFEQA